MLHVSVQKKIEEFFKFSSRPAGAIFSHTLRWLGTEPVRKESSRVDMFSADLTRLSQSTCHLNPTVKRWRIKCSKWKLLTRQRLFCLEAAGLAVAS